MPADIPKFKLKVNSMLDKGEKIPAADWFNIGRTQFGLTCKEVADTKKVILAERKGGVAPKPVKAAKAAKPEPKRKKGKSLFKHGEEFEATDEMLKDCDDSTGVVVDTKEEFIWVATPEEISADFNPHEVGY